jgi:RHS repeat-associated protein
MTTYRGPGAFTCIASLILIFHSLIWSDFWISPAAARYHGCLFSPAPDPDELVWLPYKTYCPAAQTMSSNPSYFIIDDYPETDIPDCAEIGADSWARSQEGECQIVPTSSVRTSTIFDYPLLCNGNEVPSYWLSAFKEGYSQDFESLCAGYPPSAINNVSVGGKIFVREPVGPNEIVAEKNRGMPRCGLSAGNPVNIATGNKYHRQVDTVLPGGLEIVRHYNSNDLTLHSFGTAWRGGYSRRIVTTFSRDYSEASIAVVRDDGAENYWRLKNLNPVAPPDAAGQLEVAHSNGLIIGFTYIPNDNSIETYDANGSLISVENDRGQVLYFTYTDSLIAVVATASGRALHYSYYPDGKVSRIRSDDGSSWRYFYDANNNLIQVENPDSSVIAYHYEDAGFPSALTGVTDEKGNRIRTWAYDADSRAVLSTWGNALSAVERNEIVYNTDGSTTTLGPLQNQANHSFENIHGIARFASVTDVCAGCGNSIESTNYDSRGNRDIVTDFIGNVSDYDYASNNLLQKVTYAVGTADQSEIVYKWDLVVRKPSEIAQSGQTESFSYNARGQVLNRTVTDTSSLAIRSWAYTWFEPPSSASLVGRIQSIDGPRTDVSDITSYEYYNSDHPDGDYLSGDLKAIVNALGHRTEYLKYDRNGRPLEMQDANAVLSSMTYHPRGWLDSRTTDGKTTTFTYNLAGNVERVTQADGSFTAYEYDDVHRLTAIADNFNNRVEYTLDAAGNRTSEKTYDHSGILRRQLNRVYNYIRRDAKLEQTTYEYDSLNRLVKTIDSMLGETQMEYDARDNLVSITDPLGNVTGTDFDGLNNPIRLDSPDSGLALSEYDNAGNRTAVTDARGIRTEYVFDALNRLTDIDYPDSSLDVSFTYDVGTNGNGRLARMTDAVGSVDLAYDARGNLLSEIRTIGSAQYITSYAYNDAGRLVQVTYPSGMVIYYLRDAAGRITAIDKHTGSGLESLVNGIQYEPFGPVTSFIYGNGLNYSATFDQDYELGELQSGSGLDWLLGYDPVGNLLTITDQASSQSDQAFTYDELHRLQTAQGNYGNEAFEYDANGNRTRYLNGVADDSYSYEAQSNRLAAQNGWTFSQDEAGNRIEKMGPGGDGHMFSYADHKRLAQTSMRDAGGDTVLGKYEYDGRGQRVSKTLGSTTIHFIYGQTGELIGEYMGGLTGELNEYVYLNGQAIAVIGKKTEVIQPPGAELIMDNGDPGTSSTGSWQRKSNKRDYGADYLFANKAANRTYRWTSTPPGPNYDVYAWWVSGKSFSSRVSYTIGHGIGQTDTVSKSHKSDGGQWHKLGSYQSMDGLDFVEVSSLDSKLVADAIRWVQINDPIVTQTTTTHYVHTDHLGAPRRVTDNTQTVVWSWDSRPFGNSPPNEDPDGDFTNFTLNLRFPGQYYDTESGLHYNTFRTYDPDTGRYLESDPIGLNGGLNTFTYVENAPVRLIDPDGLKVSGEWTNTPRLNLTDYGITGGKFITPYLNKWGFLKLFRVYGYAAGYVNIDVQCKDSGACDKPEWEIHERIDVSYQGYKDMGPSAAAVGAGAAAGPLAGAAAGIITLGSSALTTLLDFLREAEARGGDKIQWLYQLGPTVICLGTR